jgi:hypothetical protein
MKRDLNIIGIDVILKHQTGSAYLVESVDTGKEAWVPKSVSEYADGELQLKESLALEKGLI